MVGLVPADKATKAVLQIHLLKKVFKGKNAKYQVLKTDYFHTLGSLPQTVLR